MTEHEQLTLMRERLRRKPPLDVAGAAPSRPVARVLVDTPLAHLDRPFDYLVTAEQADTAVAGCRVKVRFAGKDVDGFVLSREDRSAHEGQLTRLRRVVSFEPVLTPEVARLCREVAERYAGTTSDLLRLAVPKRHARVEQEPHSHPADSSLSSSGVYWRAGAALLRQLRSGGSPRAVWTAGPAGDWAEAFVSATAATVASGRCAVLCVPDAQDVRRLSDAFAGTPLAAHTVVLTAELGPARRYRAFLRVARGEAAVVIGTRAAVWAPMPRLGLVAIWDDGDDLHAEPRAPYPHAREVLALRAHLAGAGLIIGGYARTAEGAALVESGWAHSLDGSRTAAPRIHVTGESAAEDARDAAARSARLPHRAFEVARAGLASGPVLVQVPRGGYLPALACVSCRSPARCSVCRGPLALSRGRRLGACGWCGRAAVGWRCPQCEAVRFRAPVVGSQRTAEELGRAFPSVPVIGSSGSLVRERVSAKPALVVCTPGAEPVAEGGYAAALLLDTWLTLSRPGLRTPEESLRRWLNACALVRPAADGGRVVVVGDPASNVVQALVRWDPVGFAARELADRASAHLPPAARVAVVSGPATDLAGFAESLDLPAGAELLGPLPVEDGRAQLVARVPRDRGSALSAALKHSQAARSARKLPHLRIHVDPVELG